MIRDLLHEQVAHGHSPGLARRWDHLVVQEAQFRHAPDTRAAEARLVAHAGR
jgi:hypothetical protein